MIFIVILSPSLRSRVNSAKDLLLPFAKSRFFVAFGSSE